ncbi:hypothetical protein CMO93_04590 [Candidatus Woesearchaeota archaeon]|nr:hypothetical protein [Candidatus Woesearchaeota archaeon]|tara:strand:+ start:22305 stop:22694 length:390 start_codon:yes stop_codon:yes gene_type:complete
MRILRLIVLKKEVFNEIGKEMKNLGLLFLIVLVIFKIAFYKENLIDIFRNVTSLFWLFVLPGYFIMLYWKKNLEFIERFIIGIGISAAIIGIFSYYIGLIGLNLKYQSILLPLLLITLGILFSVKNNNK